MSFEEDVRPGAVTQCDRCGEQVKFAVLTNWNIPTPFFYCDACNCVLLRKSDERRIPTGDTGKPKYISEVMAVYESIVTTAPPCPCGGRFALWSWVKCPHCGHEWPYNDGVRNIALRVVDAKVVLVDGAIIVGDTPGDSRIMRVQA